MKFINKVVIFVMGVVVIGVVATAIGVVIQPKTVEKSVTFELLDNDELAFNVYDKIKEYAVYDYNDNVVINFVNITTTNNDEELTDPFITYYVESQILIGDFDDDYPELYINNDSTWGSSFYSVGDVISITFEVEQETPVIIKTLIFLIPLVLSASLIGYLAFRKGENL